MTLETATFNLISDTFAALDVAAVKASSIDLTEQRQTRDLLRKALLAALEDDTAPEPAAPEKPEQTPLVILPKPDPEPATVPDSRTVDRPAFPGHAIVDDLPAEPAAFADLADSDRLADARTLMVLVLARYTGMSRDMIGRLQWGDIDVANQRIHDTPVMVGVIGRLQTWRNRLMKEAGMTTYVIPPLNLKGKFVTDSATSGSVVNQMLYRQRIRRYKPDEDGRPPSLRFNTTSLIRMDEDRYRPGNMRLTVYDSGEMIFTHSIPYEDIRARDPRPIIQEAYDAVMGTAVAGAA